MKNLFKIYFLEDYFSEISKQHHKKNTLIGLYDGFNFTFENDLPIHICIPYVKDFVLSSRFEDFSKFSCKEDELGKYMIEKISQKDLTYSKN